MAGNRKIHINLLIFSIAFCLSCSTTHIFCPDTNADIYMGNEFLDKGEASIGSIGPPNTAVFTARINGLIIGEVAVSRQFTFSTFAWGLFSYYTGWYWGWYYPDLIYIPLTNTNDSLNSPWDNQNESIWMKPLKKK